MQGKRTDPKLRGKAKAIVAKTGSIQRAAEATGLKENTIYALTKDKNFQELRAKIEQEHIIRILQQTTSIVDLLETKISELAEEKLTTVRIRELTGAVKDLRDTVKDVTQNINVDKAVFVVKWGEDDGS